MGLVGRLLHATPSNLNNLTSENIAYISCDAADYTGFVDAMSVFQTADHANASAVLFYTLTGAFCNYTSSSSDYSYIYSTINQEGANAILSYISSHASANDSSMLASIGRPDELNNTSTGSSNGQQGSASTSNHSQSNNPISSSPSTATAMIILYSITGIITALFLIVIITGAVRAHRHPERYGPRNILGRPRQTRARGLARAIVDTIPIIKFGEPREDQAKPADVELAETENSATQPMAQRAAGHAPPAEGNTEADKEVPRVSISGISPEAAPPVPTENEYAPGCSICTEDFEPGQDLRVLPCDHKFHPACIDPWLLNVSGTCPLCRIDLHPQDSRTTADGQEGEENGGLPPPLGAEDESRQRRRSRGMGLRRSLMGGVSQLSRIGEASPEERIAAARAMRDQQHSQPEQSAGVTTEQTAQDVQEETRRRRRFSQLFGIRTRRREGPMTGNATGTIPETGPARNSES